MDTVSFAMSCTLIQLSSIYATNPYFTSLGGCVGITACVLVQVDLCSGNIKANNNDNLHVGKCLFTGPYKI